MIDRLEISKAMKEMETDHLRIAPNTEQLLRLPPGKELDEWIAETLMEYEETELRRVYTDDGSYHMSRFKKGDRQVLVPPFSTEIASAMEVFQRLRDLGFQVTLGSKYSESASCTIKLVTEYGVREITASRIPPKTYSIPEAICKACVLAFGTM